MYNDPLKNVRPIIDKNIYELRNVAMTATKPSREIRQVINQTMIFDYIYKDIEKIPIQLKSINFDTSNLLKISAPSINIAKNFRNNLFSEEILNDFISSTNFQKNEVLKISNRLRQSFINTVDVSSFSETIDSPHPIDEIYRDYYNNIFKEALNHKFIYPSAKFVKNVSVASASSVIGPVLLRTILDQYVNYFVFSSVIAILFTCFLIANCFAEDDTDD
ncbi:hypothetical protein CJ235_02265 [Staphylococcus pettenkoferi]|uniref:Uncharacterized protein n=1 Tax=Staphylococcus pettenkoferi TaxID=170573 RepID=A0A2N6QLF0_9STAP|nr:hypothetical protein [Staphylococcus pettenkoferi]PMC20518.1 hypothetical protein CJ235_02265 [Staphylococcus pettenkoferi]